MNQSISSAAVSARRTRKISDAPPPSRRVLQRARIDLETKFVELQRDYAELHTAIFEAAQVHRRLCAPRLLRYGDFEIASEIFAVRHLPGDFFTVEELGSSIMMALGDICGKGLAAGMWTTHVVGMVRAHTARASAPEQIVTGINRDICRMSASRPLASLFLAKLDTGTGVIDYCSAGHPPAFLLRADGTLLPLAEGGMLLGVLDDARYNLGRVRLNADDTLMVFSDGIIESRNTRNEEFGFERLKAQLTSAQSSPADAILFSVLGAVQDFAATRPLEDDMTLAVISRDLN